MHISSSCHNFTMHHTFLTGVCSSSPCSNGGTCMEIDDGQFRCLCEYGYLGNTCDQLGKLFHPSSFLFFFFFKKKKLCCWFWFFLFVLYCYPFPSHYSLASLRCVNHQDVCCRLNAISKYLPHCKLLRRLPTVVLFQDTVYKDRNRGAAFQLPDRTDCHA